MRDKLEKIIKAYEELEKKLSDPAVASDIKEFTRLNKEYAHQSDLIAASREYIGALDDIEAAKEMLHDTTDADEKEMLQMDISENEAKLPQLEEDIKYMLIPSDPNDDKNTIVEIRSAACSTRRPTCCAPAASLPASSTRARSTLRPSSVVKRVCRTCASSTTSPIAPASSEPSSPSPNSVSNIY